MAEPPPTFYNFQRVLGHTLLVWGAASTIAGAAAQFVPNKVIKHIGWQALAWGLIDAMIALFGLRDAERRFWRGDDEPAQAQRFRRIVALNALLDIGYIAGGLALVRRARTRPERVGMGVGIVIQGGFLLLFDAFLAVMSGRWIRET